MGQAIKHTRKKKCNKILSDYPAVREQETYILAQLQDIFKNQGGDYTIFKTEMLDHFILNISRLVKNNSKEEFCAAFEHTIESLGGVLNIRNMGINNMQLQEQSILGGFLTWWSNDRVSSLVLCIVCFLNVAILESPHFIVTGILIVCCSIITVVMTKAFIVSIVKRPKMENLDFIRSTFVAENKKVFASALFLLTTSTAILTMDIGMDMGILMASVIVMPVTYMLTVYFIYIHAMYRSYTHQKNNYFLIKSCSC